MATANTDIAVVRDHQWSHDRLDLLKQTLCKGASETEFRLCMEICRHLQLDPFARQIYFVKRWDAGEKSMVLSAQVSIDGFRLIAERTGKYAGQLGPYFSDGALKTNTVTGDTQLVWYDAWPFDEPPVLAKCAVMHKGFAQPLWATAKYSSYVQTNRDGKPTATWQKMPEIMLAKCAESLALRKAFPNELAGAYTSDEMGQANKDRDGNLAEYIDIPSLPATEPVAEGDATTADRLKQAFAGIGVTPAQLIRLCGGRQVEALDPAAVANLRRLFPRLRDREVSVEQILDGANAVEPASVTELHKIFG